MQKRPRRRSCLFVSVSSLLLAGCAALEPVAQQAQPSSPPMPTVAVAANTPTPPPSASPSPSPVPTASTAAVACVPPSAGGPAAPTDAPWSKVVPLDSPLWNDPKSYPQTKSGSFWAPDAPHQEQPRAFGMLPPDLAPRSYPRLVESYVLSTTLPAAPTELPVYVVGRYPETYTTTLKEFVQDTRVWEFGPDISSLTYGGSPLGEPTTITSPQQAVQRATDVVRPFVVPSDVPAVTDQRYGGWQVVFTAHINGYPILVDRPLTVWVSTKGQVTGVQVRRRPLIAQSTYPLRSPQAAWQLLSQGCGFAFSVSPFLPQRPRGTEFAVQAVELSYLVTHASSPREIMQPYYVFRNKDSQALFVPAVADQWVQWPDK